MIAVSHCMAKERSRFSANCSGVCRQEWLEPARTIILEYLIYSIDVWTIDLSCIHRKKNFRKG